MEKEDLIKILQRLKSFWEKQKQLEALGFHIEDYSEPLEGLLGDLLVKYCPPIGEGNDAAFNALSEWTFDKESGTPQEFLNQLTIIKQKHAN